MPAQPEVAPRPRWGGPDFDYFHEALPARQCSQQPSLPRPRWMPQPLRFSGSQPAFDHPNRRLPITVANLITPHGIACFGIFLAVNVSIEITLVLQTLLRFRDLLVRRATPRLAAKRKTISQFLIYFSFIGRGRHFVIRLRRGWKRPASSAVAGGHRGSAKFLR